MNESHSKEFIMLKVNMLSKDVKFLLNNKQKDLQHQIGVTKDTIRMIESLQVKFPENSNAYQLGITEKQNELELLYVEFEILNQALSVDATNPNKYLTISLQCEIEEDIVKKLGLKEKTYFIQLT